MIVSSYLCAPNSYRRALPEVVARVVNGCGPGGWKYDLVPDTILGLRVTESCNIHDWMYNEGATETDKRLADLALRENLLATIKAAKGPANWLLRYHRRLRAYEYYAAVVVGGAAAFCKGKERPQ